MLFEPLRVHHERRAQRGIGSPPPAVTERAQALGVDQVHPTALHEGRDRLADAGRESRITERPFQDAAVPLAPAVRHRDHLAREPLRPRGRTGHEHGLHAARLQPGREVVNGSLHASGWMQGMRRAAQERDPHCSLR